MTSTVLPFLFPHIQGAWVLTSGACLFLVSCCNCSEVPVLRNVKVGETYLECETVQLKHLSPTDDSSNGAALLLQPFVRDHSANQPHTTRYKCTRKAKLSPFSALRPCKLMHYHERLWVLQQSVPFSLRRTCKPCCEICCCWAWLCAEHIITWLPTSSSCASRGICQSELENDLYEIRYFVWDWGSMKSWSSSVVALVICLSSKEIPWFGRVKEVAKRRKKGKRRPKT